MPRLAVCTTLCASLLLTASFLPAAGHAPWLQQQFGPGRPGASRHAASAAPAGISSPSDAANYMMQAIPIPANYIGGAAIDINNRGQVSGYVFTVNETYATFVLEKGVLTLYSHPDSLVTSVSAITDSGFLFGNWGSFEVQTAGFYDMKTGEWKELPPIPGKPINIGQRANNAGRATGYACEGSWTAPVNCVNWIYNGKSYEYVTLPGGATEGILNGINERNQIVGTHRYGQTSDGRSFLLDRKATIPILPDTDAFAFDINNQGQALVTYEVSPILPLVPGVWEDGVLNPLPIFPGSFATIWQGFNERGDLAGNTWSSDPPQPVIALRK